jgi:3-phytase
MSSTLRGRRMKRSSLIPLLVVTCGLNACASRPLAVAAVPSTSTFRLELAGEYLMPRETTVGSERLPVGGISGITIEPRSGSLYGVSDSGDRSRVFVFRVSGEGPSFRVRPTSAIRLGSGPDAPSKLDPEALALAGPDLLIASEGSAEEEPRVPPALLAYDSRGRFRRQLPVPSRFLPPERGPATAGVRRNEAFESLTRSPAGTRLFTASESPPVQDGPAATPERGALTRILEYRPSAGNGWEPSREFAYPLDPVAADGFTPDFSINGLVELLALSDNDLLVLERSFAMERPGGRQMNRIRLYRTSLDGAMDVASLASLSTGDVRPLTKRLVVDLADVRGLSGDLAALDNFEGVAFGPRLRDGSPSLLMVSDDNFSPTQRTAFLLFRVVTGGAVTSR